MFKKKNNRPLQHDYTRSMYALFLSIILIDVIVFNSIDIIRIYIYIFGQLLFHNIYSRKVTKKHYSCNNFYCPQSTHNSNNYLFFLSIIGTVLNY